MDNGNNMTNFLPPDPVQGGVPPVAPPVIPLDNTTGNNNSNHGIEIVELEKPSTREQKLGAAALDMTAKQAETKLAQTGNTDEFYQWWLEKRAESAGKGEGTN
ncbi:hypothetical protein IKG33_00035 [Candidatus Saccharibacteria bacterium]|nr:hypothetical protein [Candidatus Saccharibacteria bacterium]